MGFKKAAHDQCLFVKISKDRQLTLVANYVDDLLIASQVASNVSDFEAAFSRHLSVKIMGEAKRILRWQIDRDGSGSVIVTQQAYIERLLAAFGMEDSNPCPTPSAKAQRLTDAGEESDTGSQFQYRQAIGSLMYLTNNTRPDIAQSVHHAARFVHEPTSWDISQVKRILRYLRGTTSRGILFRDKSWLALYGYADSDFASCLTDPKSTSGFVFFTNGPISWSSR